MIAAAAVSAASEKDNLDLWVAVIAAGSALIGAVVGGVVSGVFSLRGEEKRQKFAREEAERARREQAERDRQVASGIARVVSVEFFKSIARVEASLELGVRADPPPRIDIATDQWRLLATHLTADQWHDVSLGVAAEETLEQGRDAPVGSRETFNRLMTTFAEALEAARLALRDLTEDAK